MPPILAILRVLEAERQPHGAGHKAICCPRENDGGKAEDI